MASTKCPPPTAHRAEKASQVRNLLEDNRELGAVVTCRELDYVGELRLDLDTLTIQPLDPPRILDFVTRYLEAWYPDHGRERGAERPLREVVESCRQGPPSQSPQHVLTQPPAIGIAYVIDPSLHAGIELSEADPPGLIGIQAFPEAMTGLSGLQLSVVRIDDQAEPGNATVYRQYLGLGFMNNQA